MGYKAGYFSLSGEKLIDITDKNLDTLPQELKELMVELKDAASFYAESKKDDPFFYYVKGAGEVFRFKGICYKLSPGFLNVDGYIFDGLMHRMGYEDKLVELGAEEVFNTGMLD